jgi:hypothetical protein
MQEIAHGTLPEGSLALRQRMQAGTVGVFTEHGVRMKERAE